MKSFKLLTIALVLTGATALSAGTINYNAALDGLTDPAGISSITATGGDLVIDSKNGVTYLGVTEGVGGDEISYGQNLVIVFDEAVRVTSLSLGLLFNGGEYGDNNEIAASWLSTGDVYELRLNAENTASYYKNNTFLFNVAGGPTVKGGKGLFEILNPFGDTVITELKLYAGKSGSDYGLVGFSAVTVPDSASTLALMGLALLGMAGLSRRVRA